MRPDPRTRTVRRQRSPRAAAAARGRPLVPLLVTVAAAEVHDLHDMMFFMLLSPLFFATTTGAAAVDLAVDLAAPAKEFPHFWERCFGSGHALLGTRADWQEHMRLAVAELGMSGVRMHGVLDDDMSVAKCADPDPKKQCYSFYNIDRVYDPLLAAGVRPIVELSFMPKAIANCDLDVCADSPCAKNNTCTPCRNLAPQEISWLRPGMLLDLHVGDRTSWTFIPNNSIFRWEIKAKTKQ